MQTQAWCSWQCHLCEQPCELARLSVKPGCALLLVSACIGCLGCRGPETIGRLAVQALGSPSWQLDCNAAAADRDILRCMLHLKALMRAAKCAACVTVPAGKLLPPASVCLIRNEPWKECSPSIRVRIVASRVALEWDAMPDLAQ
jgi:hypothetical protein